MPRQQTKPMQERILEAASKSFSEAPTATAVTMNAIAARAHVSKATLYNHFPSKEALLVALSEAGFDVTGLESEDRKSQILDRALQLFGKQGFHATTMDDIAEAVGVTKGAIYWYFKSKDDLVKAITEKHSAIPDTARMATTAFETGEEEALTLIASRLLETMQARIDVLRMAICESQRFPEVRELVTREVVGKLFAHFTQYLEQRIKAGTFRPVNPMLVTQMFVSTLVMFALAKQTLTEQLPLSDEEIVREFVHLFLDGIRKK